jgi:hypothetical protein
MYRLLWLILVLGFCINLCVCFAEIPSPSSVESLPPKSQSLSLPGIYPRAPSELCDPEIQKLLKPHKYDPKQSGCNELSLISPEYTAFWNWQDQKIDEIWKQLPGNQRPILEFQILPSGKLKKLVVRASSGDVQTDQRSINAFQKAFPLVPETTLSSPQKMYIRVLAFSDIQYAVEDQKQVTQSSEEIQLQQAWVNQIVTSANNNWNPTYSLGPVRIDVLAFIHAKTGKILSQEIAATSCNPKMDQTALDAVTQLQSVPIPTFKTPLEVIRVLITFDYNFKYEDWNP